MGKPLVEHGLNVTNATPIFKHMNKYYIKFKINSVYPVDNPVNPVQSQPPCPNPPCATAMTKVVPSSGNAQEATSPPLSDFEKALENLSPSTGGVDASEKVEEKVEEKGRQQELARKTLDKEYVQSKKHGYATNLWTAQSQGTPPGQFSVFQACVLSVLTTRHIRSVPIRLHSFAMQSRRQKGRRCCSATSLSSTQVIVWGGNKKPTD